MKPYSEEKPCPGRRQLKVTVRDFLRTRNIDEVLTWSGKDSRMIPILISLLFAREELLRWRAIEALGRAAGAKAMTDQESVRNLLRHFFWSMNDESGNLIWCAAEAIGEVLVNAQELIDEYARLLPNFLVEEPFERGAHWAVARVAGVRPDVFAKRVDELARSLSDPDPYIRGHAALALIRIEKGIDRGGVQALLRDQDSMVIYDTQSGELMKSTVQALLESG